MVSDGLGGGGGEEPDRDWGEATHVLWGALRDQPQRANGAILVTTQPASLINNAQRSNKQKFARSGRLVGSCGLDCSEALFSFLPYRQRDSIFDAASITPSASNPSENLVTSPLPPYVYVDREP